ncbi:hypothetical protein N7537_010400 [Penicillium hordei]|uniref:Uncharacterized protein n=1 Tax=Penicillium hordei TaxID=40994 RepID=A0AAD6DUX0_9EURO|nr:uncharacterized protein N7537_010400 [Penicillium hordei]KAJ5593496.1 hypothetical protein N7537_010400 [Penicillium hordei]
MDGLHNEPEAKVKHDQDRESVPPEHVNEPPVFPALQNHDQQLLPELQQPPNEGEALAAEPFQPVAEELMRRYQDNPPLAHQASQIVKLYRRLYESHLARKTECQFLEKANEELRTANLYLYQERECLQSRYAKQEKELACFGQAFDNLGTGIGSILRNSEGGILESMLETGDRTDEGAA